MEGKAAKRIDELATAAEPREKHLQWKDGQLGHHMAVGAAKEAKQQETIAKVTTRLRCQLAAARALLARETEKRQAEAKGGRRRPH